MYDHGKQNLNQKIQTIRLVVGTWGSSEKHMKSQQRF